MTINRPVQHWPGRMVDLGGGEQVHLAEAPSPGIDSRGLVLCVHGMTGAATDRKSVV